MLLRCNGFTVHDAGVDVPPEEILARAIEVDPEVIGLSGILTISYDGMQATVKALRESGRPRIAATPVIIGGGLVNEQVCRFVGADHWAKDAMGGLRTIQRLHEAVKRYKGER
jgi:5-methyltetrahydrofolate--homocysteine methyltransferase